MKKIFTTVLLSISATIAFVSHAELRVNTNISAFRAINSNDENENIHPAPAVNTGNSIAIKIKYNNGLTIAADMPEVYFELTPPHDIEGSEQVAESPKVFQPSRVIGADEHEFLPNDEDIANATEDKIDEKPADAPTQVVAKPVDFSKLALPKTEPETESSGGNPEMPDSSTLLQTDGKQTATVDEAAITTDSNSTPIGVGGCSLSSGSQNNLGLSILAISLGMVLWMRRSHA